MSPRDPDRRDFLRRGLALVGLAALGAGAALSPRRARAAGTQISARLSASETTVGDYVYLEVTVETDGRQVSPPRFPDTGELALEIEQQPTRNGGFSVSFGTRRRARSSSSKTFTYILSPTEAGELEIPIEVVVDGEVHRLANPLKLSATGADAEPRELVMGQTGDRPQSADAEVIVWPMVDRAVVYVGEQLVYELHILERSSGNLSISTAPTFRDFWSVDLSTPQTRGRNLPREVVQGVAFRLHQTMRRALFPQKSGTLAIGGPKISKTPTVALFGSPRGSQMPERFQGRNLGIEVLPLPAAGQPVDFPANNVGQYEIDAEVDRRAMRQGEAVRVTVTVTGVGNISLVQPGAWPSIEGARVYDPKPETPELDDKGERLQGRRRYTMLVVAEQAGTIEIPAFELPYFDPETGAYALAKSDPITLEVAPNPGALAAGTQAGDPAPGSSPGSTREQRESLLAAPVGGQQLERVTPKPRWLDERRWWVGTLAGPGLLALGWLALRARARFGPDEGTRRRGRTQAQRRTQLAAASAAVGDGEGFYPKLAAVLQSAAVERAGLQGVGLARDRLMSLLATRGLEGAEVERLRGLLDACDAARFGAGAGDESGRRAHLEDARSMLADRHWRPS